MRKMVPFKLDPMLTAIHSVRVPCADCGKVVEFRHARIVMVNISDRKSPAGKEISLDELARNAVWTFLCPECWRKQHGIDPEPDRVQ